MRRNEGVAPMKMTSDLSRSPVFHDVRGTSIRCKSLLSILLAASLWLPQAEGQESAAKSPTSSSENLQKSIPNDDASKFIKILETGNQTQRREATARLIDLGKSAIDPLAQEAAEANAATMYYCFDALAKLLSSNEADVSNAARSALERLTESQTKSVGLRAKSVLRLNDVLGRNAVPPQPGNIIGPVAVGGTLKLTTNKDGKVIQLERAADGTYSGKITEKGDAGEKTTEFKAADRKELENKYPEVHKALKEFEENRNNPQPVLVPLGNPLGGALNLNIQANGLGGGVQIKTSIVNGARSIEVKNGDEKILINDVNGKNITLKHTRTVDGKEKTDEYKAQDVNDLIKKHPDAAKLYEKYGGANGMLPQIQIQALPNGQRFNGGIQLTPTGSGGLGVGPRSIEVELEGQRLLISDDDGRKIQIKVIRTVEGKDVEENYSSETAKQLKTDHPEIAKIYEKYTGIKCD